MLLSSLYFAPLTTSFQKLWQFFIDTFPCFKAGIWTNEFPSFAAQVSDIQSLRVGGAAGQSCWGTGWKAGKLTYLTQRGHRALKLLVPADTLSV